MVIFDVPGIHFSPVPDQFSLFIHEVLMHDVIAFVNLIFKKPEHGAVYPLYTAYRFYSVFIQVSFDRCRSISVCCHLIDFSYPYGFCLVSNKYSSLVFCITERPLKVLYGNSCLILSLIHHLCTSTSTFTFCLCECCKDRKHQFAFP